MRKFQKEYHCWPLLTKSGEPRDSLSSAFPGSIEYYSKSESLVPRGVVGLLTRVSSRLTAGRHSSPLKTTAIILPEGLQPHGWVPLEDVDIFLPLTRKKYYLRTLASLSASLGFILYSLWALTQRRSIWTIYRYSLKSSDTRCSGHQENRSIQQGAFTHWYSLLFMSFNNPISGQPQ